MNDNKPSCNNVKYIYTGEVVFVDKYWTLINRPHICLKLHYMVLLNINQLFKYWLQMLHGDKELLCIWLKTGGKGS